MDIISNNYLPGDQRLIEQIVRELKSQGIFDQFRRECISDVDTKPAYQNLRQRVESSVSGFLTTQTWSPEMNKNQVREMLRKNIHESGFLETGVERIVDQVVNPKINSIFLPKVEDVVYKFLGIEKPVKTNRSIPTPLGISTIQDLLPKDLEAISPEMPDDHDDLIEDITEDVKMDEEPSMNSVPNSIPGKVVIEENSVDSQSSILSAITSHNSNQSQKQESVLSVNGSENRGYHTSSESRSNTDFENVQSNDNISDVNSKIQQSVEEKMDIAASPPKDESQLEEINTSEMENVSQTSIETPVKSKDSSDKKKERHHSSSDKSKARSDRDKDKSKSDKYKKEDKDVSKEQKSEKEKYRIPKLSDKKKAEKDSKSREKNDRSKEREKDDKNRSKSGDKDNKKTDKEKKSKHSSETDKSRNEDSGKSKKDKHERSEKKYSKDDRKSSSSSKHSSKDRHREKDRDGKNKNEESADKNKNGHRSSSSGANSKDKQSSKYKKEDEKSRSSRKKDEKDDKKKKRSSKDDHYSSKDKKNERRSSDRDSDDASSNKKTPPVVQKKIAETTQHLSQESTSSNMEESTGESGNSDQVEGNNEENIAAVQLNKRKFRLPKFASNLGEAMKIMKIRKQIKKFENMDADSPEMKSLMLEIEQFSKDINKDKKEMGNANESDLVQEERKEEKECSKNISVDINDFISSSGISMAKWNALEEKFMGELGKIDYDSYESPYVDDEESVIIEKMVEEEKYEDKEQIGEADQVEVPNETSGDNENLEVDGEVYLDTSEIVSEEVILHSCNEISIKENECVTEVVIEETLTETEENLNRSQELIEKDISIEEPVLFNGSIEHEIPEKSEPIQQTENTTPSCQTTPIISPDILKEENSTDIETNYFSKKAVVILEKNSITEEMIEKNGEIDERLKVLEIEKENIETNKIVDENRVALEDSNNVTSVSVLEEEGDKRKHNNKLVNKDLPKSFNQVLTEKNGKRKSRTLSSGVENGSTTNEDVCKSLEPPENVKALNILKCLIKDIEDNIMHIVERMKKNDHVIVKKITVQNGKRKRRGQKSDISNNNVEVSASKRMKTKNLPATIRTKKVTELNNKEVTENDADKLLDAKLCLPLTPDGNENFVDKKADSQNSRITKCTRQSGNAVGDVEKIADVKKSTPVKKCKIPGEILSEKKNGAKQRYSCEDLYKPRIFLRRSGKNTKKS